MPLATEWVVLRKDAAMNLAEANIPRLHFSDGSESSPSEVEGAIVLSPRDLQMRRSYLVHQIGVGLVEAAPSSEKDSVLDQPVFRKMATVRLLNGVLIP